MPAVIHLDSSKSASISELVIFLDYCRVNKFV